MLKAIQTKYKGYRFRSRLEARWAVFFTDLDVAFDYEPEGFVLPSGPYLPDFFLPDFNAWAEVKSTYPTAIELKRALELSEESGQLVFLLINLGPPIWSEHRREFSGLNWMIKPGRELHQIQAFAICPITRMLSFGPVRTEVDAPQHNDERIYAAYRRARGARFEHGEKP